MDEDGIGGRLGTWVWFLAVFLRLLIGMRLFAFRDVTMCVQWFAGHYSLHLLGFYHQCDLRPQKGEECFQMPSFSKFSKFSGWMKTPITRDRGCVFVPGDLWPPPCSNTLPIESHRFWNAVHRIASRPLPRGSSRWVASLACVLGCPLGAPSSEERATGVKSG